LIAASAVVISTFVGCLLGLVAGYTGGWISATLLRLADAIISFPSMLLAVMSTIMLMMKTASEVTRTAAWMTAKSRSMTESIMSLP
ncbi:hypothetical protein ACC703_39015, partial [Rhizobium ruizarguesonis]